MGNPFKTSQNVIESAEGQRKIKITYNWIINLNLHDRLASNWSTRHSRPLSLAWQPSFWPRSIDFFHVPQTLGFNEENLSFKTSTQPWHSSFYQSNADQNNGRIPEKSLEWKRCQKLIRKVLSITSCWCFLTIANMSWCPFKSALKH